MRTFKKVIFILGIAAFALACKKDDDSGLLDSDEPQIYVVDMFPTTARQFRDSVTIIIAFEDRNGDLGYTNPDDPSLEIRDTRITEPELYHIPPITPDKQELYTKGTFKVVLPSVFLFGNGGAERTNFHIRVKDRESHWSEYVFTPDLYIK